MLCYSSNTLRFTREKDMNKGVSQLPVAENSFWAKWLTLRKALFKKCITITDQYHDAEDLLSEVMYKAYLKRPKDKRDLKHFENWLGVLVKNIAVDIKRHNQKLIHIEDIEILLHDKSVEFSRSPRQEVLYQEHLFLINDSIKDFSPKYRHIVHNYFINDYNYEDITKAYNLNAEYARKIVSKARKKITEYLNSYETGKKNIATIPDLNLEVDNIYDHSIMVGTPHNFHFCTIFTDVTPGRLKQKEKSYQEYISKTPSSGLKRLLLAKNLMSQGKLSAAKTELDLLIDENYNDDDVFEYKLLISKILGNDIELKSITNLAVDMIPNPPIWIKALQLQVNACRKSSAEFYQIHLSNNPKDINSRVQYIHLLEEMEHHQNSCNECKNLQKYSPYNLKIMPIFILHKLNFENFTTAKDYTKSCFNLNPNSITVSIYHLHFIVRDYKSLKDTGFINLILSRMRKKYAWHPDFALFKALIEQKEHGNIQKRTKTLIRRCSDYPGCAISKYYLKIFGKVNDLDLPELSPSVRLHLEIVKAIYKSYSTTNTGG